jgi:hypothetical protein
MSDRASPGRVSFSRSAWAKVGRRARPWAFFVSRVGKGVESVELRYEDGTASRVPLTGRYFLEVIAGPHTRRGHRPLVFIARDSNSRVVATQRLDRR